MLTYEVTAKRVDIHESVAQAKQASIVLDTGMAGRLDAFNPAELFLASIAACMIKGIERVTPILNFNVRGVTVRLHGERQDKPPKMVSVTYVLTVDTDESEQRLDLLHKNVRQFGTISNTVADTVKLTGEIRKKR